MKIKNTLFAVLMLTFAFNFGTVKRANAQCNIGSNAIVCPGFVVGQEESGFGTFTGGEEWSALGRAPFPAPNGDFSYGLRLQRTLATALFQLKRRTGNNAPDAPVDANVYFGNATTSSGKTLGTSRMDFDYVFQNQSTFPPSVSQTNIMTLTANNSKFVSVSSNLQLACPIPFPFPTAVAPCFGRVGIERTNPTYTLDVNGIVRTTGLIIGSDARYKENVQTIENGMEIVRQLRGTTYNLKSEQVNGFDFDGGEKAGFIAQEVEQVIPAAVFTDDEGYKSVDYIAVIPYLVEGMKELQDENSALRAELEDVRQQLDATGSSKGAGSLGSMREAELFQNIPNPFDQETRINYYLPDNVRNATMLVFDMNGRQVRSFEIERAGQGSITIQGTELEAGMYIYSLLADGQEIASKRMILTK
ncbi:MAG: tail fiber domain-containing protein [Bacteroidota bacterium]